MDFWREGVVISTEEKFRNQKIGEIMNVKLIFLKYLREVSVGSGIKENYRR